MRENISFIVVANHNHCTLAKTLKGVEISSVSGDELILCLSNPDRQTLEIAQSASKWKVIFETHPGAASARNRGASLATQRILCFLDADILIDPDWCNVMLGAFSNPWIYAGQSRIKQEKGKGLVNYFQRCLYFQFNTYFYQCDQSIGLPTLDSAALLVRRDVFEKLKGFDETFLRYEDTDFTWRCLYDGGDLFFEDRAFALELNDESETLLIYLYKRYLSALYRPKIFKRHGLNFFFPFSGLSTSVPKRRHFSLPIQWFFRFITLMGIVRSPFPLEVSPLHGPVYKASKRKILEGGNYFERAMWVGAKEKRINLVLKKITEF